MIFYDLNMVGLFAILSIYHHFDAELLFWELSDDFIDT